MDHNFGHYTKLEGGEVNDRFLVEVIQLFFHGDFIGSIIKLLSFMFVMHLLENPRKSMVVKRAHLQLGLGPCLLEASGEKASVLRSLIASSFLADKH